MNRWRNGPVKRRTMTGGLLTGGHLRYNDWASCSNAPDPEALLGCSCKHNRNNIQTDDGLFTCCVNVTQTEQQSYKQPFSKCSHSGYVTNLAQMD